MKFNDIRVSTKLWGGILGLLVVALAVGAWSQHNGAVLSDRAVDSVRAYEQRISYGIEWRGTTATISEQVITSSATADTALTNLYDARVKAGVEGVNKLQARIVGLATGADDKAALAAVAAERTNVLGLIKKARELQQASSTAAVPAEFVEKTWLPAVARYLDALDGFVRLQERHRDAALAELDASRQRSLEISLVCAFIVLAAGVALAAALVRGMSRPLAHAVGVAESIAGGDLSSAPQTDRRDEFGQLLLALSSMSAKLRGVVGEVRHGVESVTTASAEIAHGNHDLSARTEQTAANLQQTAASMEQLTSTVTQSTETAHRARQLAGTAAQAATRGGEVMSEVVRSMEQISGSSRRIGDIIGTIDGIAFQTNILALNAAVEAARAGEQGRGFAVVASEVRGLAQRSAQAAREIKTLIGASVETVDTGSRQVAQAGQTMGEIVSSVRQVSDLIAEIHAASSEQRDGIGQVNQAVVQLDQMTQQNAALVEESAAAASSLRDQAQRLSEAISVFKLETGGRPATAFATAGPTPAAPMPALASLKKASVPAPAKAPPKAQALPASKASGSVAKETAGNGEDWETF